jgi:hypothetical protein
MTTLADIETAADALTEVAGALAVPGGKPTPCARAQAPEPRTFSADTINAWIAEDEADFERLSRSP